MIWVSSKECMSKYYKSPRFFGAIVRLLRVDKRMDILYYRLIR